MRLANLKTERPLIVGFDCIISVVYDELLYYYDKIIIIEEWLRLGYPITLLFQDKCNTWVQFCKTP